jgi:hypothetical protein
MNAAGIPLLCGLCFLCGSARTKNVAGFAQRRRGFAEAAEEVAR